MWQHCNNNSYREDRMELDVDGINQMSDTFNNDNDDFWFTILLRLCFTFIKGNARFVHIT
jgi:hypothetical protein